MTIAHALLERARAEPAALALVAGEERRTYGELAQATLAAAAAAERATPAGGRLALLAPPGGGLLAAFLGAALAGRMGVVLQAGWSGRELRLALEVARPDLVAAPPAWERRLRSAGLHPGVCRFWPRFAAETDTPRGLPRVDAEQPFYAGFTSGTTGRPRAFVRSHRSWLRSVEVAGPVLGIAAGEHLLAPGPLDHSLFLYAAVHGLSAGATVHLQRRFAPHALLRTLATLPPNRLVVVPAMLAALLHAARPGIRLPAVRAVICSGAVLPRALLRRCAEVLPAAEVVDVYGASELSFVASRRAAPDDAPDLVGHPLAGVEVAVRDERGQPVPCGGTGRLWVRSDLLFSGYLGPADPAGAVRDEAGWVTVSDLGRRDAQGRLYLAGRAHTMLNCAGTGVYPEEIEQVLLECPGVAEAAVVGWDDEDRGQVPWAVVRLGQRGSGEAVTRRRLEAHCRARLARGKRPRRWLLVEDFPRTPAGKVARAALAAALRDGRLATEDLT